MLTRLVTRSASGGKRVIYGAVLVAVFCAIFGSTLLARMTTDVSAPDAESVRAAQRITQAAGMDAEADVVAVVSPPGGIDSREGRERFSDIARKLHTFDDAASVMSYLNSPDPSLLSKDGHSGLIVVHFVSGVNRDETAARVIDLLGDEPDVLLGGEGVAGSEIKERLDSDLTGAELIALPLLFLIALWVFRSVVAAAVTIATGVLTILVTLAVLRVIVTQVELSSFVMNLVTGLGLGLSIDYSLFIISRYREETVRHGHGRKAAVAAGYVAGRTVFFSAFTVAAAVAALMLFPQRFLFSMGVGGTVVTLAAAIVCVTLLPAVLAVLGPRIDSGGLPGARRALETDTGDVHRVAWYRLAQWVMNHARIVVIGTTIVIVVLIAPVFHARFSMIDVRALPANAEPRQVTEVIEKDFPGGGGTPLSVAVDAAQSRTDEIKEYAERLGELPGISAVAPPSYLGNDTWLVNATIPGDPYGDAAQQTVRDVRGLKTGSETLVGGPAASYVDTTDLITSRLGPALLLVVLVVLVLVFLLTGSLVLSVKTFVVNVINVLMTLGVLVWIFQDGHFESMLGFSSNGEIDLGTPILVLVLGFGLSTDYGVFLLARIKEAFVRTGDNDEAVATGLGRTGRIISSAAILMCVAIGAFSASSLLFVKQLGVGVAVSVILDATLIRALLVPAAMALMADINWWAPASLRRIHERYGVDESAELAPEAVAPAVVHEPVPALVSEAGPGLLPVAEPVSAEQPLADPFAAFAAAALADVAAKLAEAGWTRPTLSGAPAGPPKLRLIPSPPFDDEPPILTVVPTPIVEPATVSSGMDLPDASSVVPLPVVPSPAASAYSAASPGLAQSAARHRLASDPVDAKPDEATRRRAASAAKNRESRYLRKPAHLRNDKLERRANGRHRR